MQQSVVARKLARAGGLSFPSEAWRREVSKYMGAATLRFSHVFGQTTLIPGFDFQVSPFMV